MKITVKRPTMTLKLTAGVFFALLIGVMLCHHTVFDYFAIVIGKLPFVSIFKPFFFPVLYALLVVLSFNPARFKWIRLTDLGIILFFTVSIMLSSVFYPQNSQYIADRVWSTILPCVPFFFLGLCTDLDAGTYRTVSVLSCWAVIINTLYLIYFLDSGRELGGSHGEDYSMHQAYLILPNLLLAIDYAFRSRKLFPIVCSAVGIVYTFSMGTRGPIVVLAVAVIVCIWRYMRLRTSRKIVAVVVLAVAISAFVSSPLYMKMLLDFVDFLIEKGVSTRVVDYLISGEMISQTSGRDDIYIHLLNKLLERPLLGYGVYGEYPLGYHAGAHNIYLQVVFHLGYPLGIALLLSYICVFIKALIKTKGSLMQGWIAMFGCLVFVRGLFGGSYLDYSVFFLLGLCLKSLRESSCKLDDK